MTRAAHELVFAVCHEIGNLLAAIRLHSELLDETSAAGVSQIAGRAGSLLALVRPLLAGCAASAGVEPIQVLDDLRRGLESTEERVRIELKSAATLPDVETDAETLHHLLLAAVFAGLHDEPDQPVRVWAEDSGAGVAFVVGGAGDPGPAESATALSGRRLVQALADRLLRAPVVMRLS